MRSSFLAPFLVSVLIIISTIGCDNSIEPFSEESTYSVYGYLSTSRSQQYVRVKDLSEPITKTDSLPLDVEVVLESSERESSEPNFSEVLKDSVVSFIDEGAKTFTHNYWTDRPIEPNTDYNLHVVESGKQIVTAETTTPTDQDPDISPDNGNCLTDFDIYFGGVDDTRLVDLFAEVKHNGDWHRFEIFPRTESEDTVVASFEVEGLISNLVPSQDRGRTRCKYEPRCLKLDSDKVKIEFVIRSPGWFGNSSSASFSLDLLDSKDVTNGPGFFRSLRQDQSQVTVDTSSVITIVNPPFCPDTTSAGDEISLY